MQLPIANNLRIFICYNHVYDITNGTKTVAFLSVELTTIVDTFDFAQSVMLYVW